MRHLHFGKLFFVVFSLLLACTVSARKPIKTLLITGQNNHNWQVSHVVLKQILENSGRFDVDFVISPEQGKDMSGFVLDFSPYQLVVLDYNGDSWPEETNRRIAQHMPGTRGGKRFFGFRRFGKEVIRPLNDIVNDPRMESFCLRPLDPLSHIRFQLHMEHTV